MPLARTELGRQEGPRKVNETLFQSCPQWGMSHLSEVGISLIEWFLTQAALAHLDRRAGGYGVEYHLRSRPMWLQRVQQLDVIDTQVWFGSCAMRG